MYCTAELTRTVDDCYKRLKWRCYFYISDTTLGGSTHFCLQCACTCLSACIWEAKGGPPLADLPALELNNNIARQALKSICATLGFLQEGRAKYSSNKNTEPDE